MKQTVFFVPTLNEARAILKNQALRRKTISDFSIFEAKTDSPFVLVVTGMGIKRTVQAFKIVAANYDIKEMIHCGVCGGTSEKIKSGDILVAGFNLFPEDNEIPSNSILVKKFEKLFNEHKSVFHLGKIITVTKPLDAPEKKLLGLRYSCQGVDMEGYALAKEATQNNIPFVHVRWILDEMNDWLPPKFVFDDKVKNVLKKMGDFFHFYFEERSKAG